MIVLSYFGLKVNLDKTKYNNMFLYYAII